MFYEAARSANWFVRSPRSASTQADRSKRATQLSPGAALPALCLLCSGRLGFAVHQSGDSVYCISGKSFLVHQIGDSLYGDKDYDENGQEKGTYFGAVWCMGLCHEVVRRTRIWLLVYGMGEKYDAVHGNGVLVYGVRGVNCATADKCVSRMFFCGKIFLTSLAC